MRVGWVELCLLGRAEERYLSGFHWRTKIEKERKSGQESERVWLDWWERMNEDSQSHYQMDAGDRLNGLGQRRRKPKKVNKDMCFHGQLGQLFGLVSLLAFMLD